MSPKFSYILALKKASCSDDNTTSCFVNNNYHNVFLKLHVDRGVNKPRGSRATRDRLG
ncbi:hypothetical protein HanIR_Chr09g0447541 [Helianthus annuus]|nr:hypothetical protein HanIR_Chr09g0447541 [Helianthus annuus]